MSVHVCVSCLNLPSMHAVVLHLRALSVPRPMATMGVYFVMKSFLVPGKPLEQECQEGKRAMSEVLCCMLLLCPTPYSGRS